MNKKICPRCSYKNQSENQKCIFCSQILEINIEILFGRSGEKDNPFYIELYSVPVFSAKRLTERAKRYGNYVYEDGFNIDDIITNDISNDNSTIFCTLFNKKNIYDLYNFLLEIKNNIQRKLGCEVNYKCYTKQIKAFTENNINELIDFFIKYYLINTKKQCKSPCFLYICI